MSCTCMRAFSAICPSHILMYNTEIDYLQLSRIMPAFENLVKGLSPTE